MGSLQHKKEVFDCYNNQSHLVVAILYVMVQNLEFSFIICSLKSKDNIMFAHNFYSKTKHKQSNLLPSTSIEYIFPFIRIRYFILLAINTHIDCSNNSKCSVRHSLGNQTRSLWKCLLQHFLLD